MACINEFDQLLSSDREVLYYDHCLYIKKKKWGMKFNINQDLGVNIFKSLKAIHHHCHT